MSKVREEIGAYRFDAKAGSLSRTSGATITLRPQTAAVLRVLCKRHGQIVSRDELINEVWPATTVTEDSVTQCIKEIRAALGDEGHRFVRTFPKRGYMLDVVAKQPPRQTRATKSFWRALLAGFALAGIALIFLRPWSEGELPSPEIVVLPFQDVSQTDRWTRIGVGLASEVSAALARNDWLEVRQSGLDSPVSNGQTYILAGTVSATTGNVRLTATLSDGQAGRILWSEVWSGSEDNVFALQSSLLERVEATIASSWTGVIAKDRIQKTATSPRNLGAFDLYLRAIEQKHLFTSEALVRAQQYLEQALELEPDYGRAWTALAVVHLLQMEGGRSVEDFEMHLQRRIEATERALALSPNDPETLIQATFLYGRAGDYATAEAALRKATRIGRNNPDILAQAAWGGARRVPVGADAVGWAQRAFDLNPTPPPWYHAALATSAFYAGEYALADEAYSKAPPLTEILYRHAATAEHLGDHERARELLSRARMKLPDGLTITELEAADGSTFPSYVERLTRLVAQIDGR